MSGAGKAGTAMMGIQIGVQFENNSVEVTRKVILVESLYDPRTWQRSTSRPCSNRIQPAQQRAEDVAFLSQDTGNAANLKTI